MTFDDLFDGSDSHRMRHVIPTNDLREHSMDERESYEQGRKPQ
jgi:hypothetical protein